MIFWRKKKVPDQDPVSTRLGEFVFDPKYKEWRCTLDDETEYTIHACDFSQDFAEKLFHLAEREKQLHGRFTKYITSNWIGEGQVEGIEYLGGSCSEEGELSISYSTETDEFGIIIDLDDDLNFTGHMWYD